MDDILNSTCKPFYIERSGHIIDAICCMEEKEEVICLEEWNPTLHACRQRKKQESLQSCRLS